MGIIGLRDTSNFVSGERPLNWREGIMLLYPNGKTPLFAMTSLLPSRAVDDPEYNWWTKSMATQRLALSENLGTGATDPGAVVSGALELKIGDILRVEQTGEYILIAANPTVDTELGTVVRDYGNTNSGTGTAVTFATSGVNINMFLVGNAYEEGSSAPSGIGRDPAKITNFTQIFRNTFEITNTAIETNLRTGDAVKEAKRECLEMHSMAIERALWFGLKRETTRNSKPVRMTNGILNLVAAANIVDHSTDAVTMEMLELDMLNMFRFGSSEKVGFCGNRAALTIQQVIRKNTTWQFRTGDKEFGMDVSRLTCPFGSLVFKTHPLFNQIVGGTNTTAYFGVDSWLFVLDMKELKYVYLRNRDTKFQPKLQANDADGLKAGFLTECGLELHHPTTHYLLKGMAAAAADA